MKTNATIQELNQALAEVNKRFDGNIKFKNIEQKGKKVNFTLTVISSFAPGHRLGCSLTSKGNQKKIAAACWHVHGYFFEELFKINPNAIVKTGDKTIDQNQGNWQDWNIGSISRPLNYSDACECTLI
jgi:hypothetical protein